MSGIETFGSTCPCCGKQSVWSKHETSNQALMFDACVECGFIDWVSSVVRNDDHQTAEGRNALWEMLLHRLDCKSLEDVRKVTESWGVDDAWLVFNYDGYSKELLESKRIASPTLTLSEVELNSAVY